MKKTSILILIALLALGQTAWAQQVRNIAPKSLPYSYGFEDPDEFNCWTRVNCHDNSKISQNAAYEGDYGFDFYYSTTPPQYLISPQFVGNTGINVSFYYKNTSDAYPETFQVGYSTTIESPNDFTWSEEVTANDQYTWKLYEAFFPIGTKYVAVKLTSNDQFHLYLDNFSFEPAFCANEDRCELTFELTDTYGDSWNGNAIRVVDVESNTILAEMTNVEYNTETYTLAVCDGRELRFEWVTGEWPEECSYTVTDINGNEVFSGEGAMNEPVSFTPDCTPIFDFEGYWNDGNNWNIGVVPQEGKDVAVKAAATIPGNYCAHVGNIDMQEGGSILIEDGGQLKHSNEVQGTIQKFIQGFGSNDNQGGWYLLKEPIIRPFTLDKAIESGMVGGTLDDPDFTGVDLYSFRQTNESEWYNWKTEIDHFINTGIAVYNGWLYAHDSDVTLNFITDEQHPFVSTATDTYVTATRNPDQTVDFIGWNLIGNPFTCDAYLTSGRDFYRMNADGDAIVLATDENGGNVIKPCEGIFVVIGADDPETSIPLPGMPTQIANIQFTTTEPEPSGSKGLLDIKVMQEGQLADVARVRFGQGDRTDKLVLRDNATLLGIRQDGKDYSVVYNETQGELPLSFKAKANGQYTLSVDPTGVELDYLHLIDNMTGADVDLLQTTSYSFNAKTTDYASRFKLVFATICEDADGGSETFAFISNGEIIVNGKGTLQVIDLLGRQLSSQEIHSTFHIPHSALPSGVYVLRLVNGNDVRTQKIVVK